MKKPKLREPELVEGEQAIDNFERAMTSLFRVPKAQVVRKIKKKAPKGKDWAALERPRLAVA